MERRIGTVSRGLRGPIIKEGDDLKKIAVDTLMACIDNGDFEIGTKDVFAVTESILARAQANYATTDQRNRRSCFPYTQQEQICHLPQRHGQRRQEDRPHAQLSQRRSGQPPAGH